MYASLKHFNLKCHYPLIQNFKVKSIVAEHMAMIITIHLPPQRRNRLKLSINPTVYFTLPSYISS